MPGDTHLQGRKLESSRSLIECGVADGAAIHVAVSPVTNPELDLPCRDRYPGASSYKPSRDTDPVPPFPCAIDERCTAENRICDCHRKMLFVKQLSGDTIEIPFGNWEVPLWYKCRIHNVTDIPLDKMQLIYAGSQLDDHRRHSGLQIQSTLHLVVR